MNLIVYAPRLAVLNFSFNVSSTPSDDECIGDHPRIITSETAMIWRDGVLKPLYESNFTDITRESLGGDKATLHLKINPATEKIRDQPW